MRRGQDKARKGKATGELKRGEAWCGKERQSVVKCVHGEERRNFVVATIVFFYDCEILKRRLSRGF